MSQNQNPDPGGSQDPSRRELSDLKDQNEQQLVLIAQLKEMLRKSDQQSNVTDDKVQEYVKTLSRKKKNKSNKDEESLSVQSTNIDANKKERLNLLKQQMEENKAKLAERGKSQKGLEEMVTQLTVQFNDSQQLISQSPLNLSLQETKTVDYNKNTPPEELYNILLSKEKKITELTGKVQKLEGNVLDLQENLKEKDSVIDARTKAITLMTESLSKKGKNTLDQLDETKDQMRKMQQNFIKLEEEMKNRQLKLLDDLKLKNTEILDLQELNAKLEAERDDLRRELDETVKKLEESKESPKSSPTKGGKKKKGKQNQKTAEPEVDFTVELEELKKLNQDLISKNQELVDENNNLVAKQQTMAEENEQLLAKVQTLEEELNQMKDQIRESITAEQQTTDNDEVAKLKKQLDESNKSTIKMKAQHKSKIKELNKKLDTFKKMNDSNALILQLQNEISKLEQKIAELEEEKGNLQLSMVESTEDTRLKEKEELVLSLKSDNQNLNKQIQELNDQIQALTQAQNDNVKSEMSNIQIEEKLDQLENEKKLVEDEKERLVKDNQELEEKLNFITKEKTELNAKLENYIQENMELIDKLEKLSAEKVSSAESIEIVEGLTQQEKLELAAYQQNLEIPADLQWNKDDPSDIAMDQSEPPEELNESVLQLNEDSTELLRKIEMFNVERKEVMLKLDALREENLKLNEELKDFERIKEENNSLSLKLKEVENTRDVLEETYEQLQTEKDMLEEKLKGSPQGDIESQLLEMEKKCTRLVEENETMKKSLKELNESVFEKERELREQLELAKKETDGFDDKLKDHLEEIDNYKIIIEENKQELISSSQLINKMQSQLTESEQQINNDKQEIELLNSKIADLNTALQSMEDLQNNKNQEVDVKVNENLSILEEQLNTLKSTLSLQLGQAQEYEKELSENYEIITQLNAQLKELNTRLANNEQHLQASRAEVDKLSADMAEQEDFIKNLEKTISEKSEELSHKDKQIAILQQTIGEKDIKFNELTKDLTDKFLKLQEQFDGNNGTMETKIHELQTKNKELVEKLKKLAANLKKKTQDYKELEESFKGSADLQQQINQLTSEKVELEQNNVELQNVILRLKEEKDKEKETVLTLKQEFSNVQEQTDSAESIVAAKDVKIKELEMIIETQENDLSDYKGKISRLEEGLAILEERRQSLERTNVELGDKLMETSASFEEKSYEEEQLEQRLATILHKDELLTKRLETVTLENEELTLKNQDFIEEHAKYNEMISNLQDQLGNAMMAQNSVSELEQANAEYVKHITALEHQMKVLQQNNDLLKEQNKSAMDKYENEIQVEMDEMLANKNEIVVKNEKLEEQVQELIEKNNELVNVVEEQQIKLNEAIQENAKITELNNLLLIAQDEVKVLKAQEVELLGQVEELKKDLLNATASGVVDCVISEAKSQVASKETSPVRDKDAIPTFTWSDNNEASDWFNVVVEPTMQKQELVQVEAQTSESDSGNSREELLQKIKTLEFMLYSMEKEKDNALLQCHELSNELTRLVYERENNAECSKAPTVESNNVVPVDLESQILSQADVVDSQNTKDLQSLEFEPVQFTQAQPEAIGEVVEESFGKKVAYKCYKDGDDGGIPEDMQNVKSGEGFVDDNDDGWGWGPEEAKKEEAHMLTSSVPEINSLKTQVESLTEQLRVFQLERDQHLDEIKQLQIKSGKLIKKCKEFKLKYEQVVQNQKGQTSAAKPDDFFNLDGAIQDELKSQVETLEKNLKEANNELNKERTEKANILKQVEVLSAANEKMVDKIEILNVDLINAKRQYEEASEKLALSEWDNDSFSNQKPDKVESTDNSEDFRKKFEESKKQVEELKDSLNDIMLDNEELQSLLEEQKNLRVAAENKLKNVAVQQENVRSEEEYLAVVNELKSLKDAYNEAQANLKTEEEYSGLLNLKNDLENQLQLLRENSRSIDEFNALLAEKANLLEQVENMQNNCKSVDEYNALLAERQSLQQQIEKLTINQSNCRNLDEYNALVAEKQSLHEQVENLNSSINQWMHKYEEECQSKNDLQMRFMHIETNYENITRELSELRLQAEGEKELLQQQIVAKDQACANLSQEKTELEEKITDLEQTLQLLQDRLTDLTEQSKMIQNEYNDLQLKNTKGDALEEVRILEGKVKDLDARNKELCAMNAVLEENTTQLQMSIAERDHTIEEMGKKLIIGDYQTMNQKLTNVEQQRSNLEDFKNRMESFLDNQELRDLKEDFRRTLGYYESLHSIKEHRNDAASFFDNLPTEQNVGQIGGQQNVAVDHFEQEVVRLQEEVLKLSEKVEKLSLENTQLNEHLNKNDFGREIQELRDENVRLQTHLELTVEDLNKKWEEECISRGDVIAETWKQHLESVELEFTQTRDKLQLEIVEYEEKCNALVNENNELRKNVDAEIRNEVDKLSELQKTISELSHNLQQREGELNMVRNELMVLQAAYEEKDKKLESVNVVIETTLKQFDEKREVVEEIVKILEQNASWPLSFEKEAIVAEFQRQLAVASQNQGEVTTLLQKMQDLESNLVTANRDLEFKTGELANTFQMLSESKVKIEELTEAQATFISSLDEKNREISLLNEKLQHFEALENDNNRDVHNLQSELDECKNTCVVLQNSLTDTQNQLFNSKEEYQEKLRTIDELSNELQSLQQLYRLKDEEFEAKCKELSAVMEQQTGYSQNEELYKNKLRELENYYENMLLEKQNDLDGVKSLNAGLQIDLESLKEGNMQLPALQQQLYDYQQYYQDYSVKMQEISDQLTERTQYCQSLEAKINDLQQTVEELNSQLLNQSSELSENDKEVGDLKQIIEGQVVKIEELKKDLFAKSQDFDSLIAEVDISNVKNTGAITKQPVATTGEVSKPQRSDELTDAVSRAELDLALYMLHQRDVRCEELTVELTQLLEERDTLQLRLSNAIREKEDLRRRTQGVEEPSSSHAAGGFTNSPSKSGAIFMAASGIEVGTEPTEESGLNLETKLSELKQVGYKKDKTFVDEQELRRLQQMAIMQEHIHEASKLPPEAAQKLVDASYTLSRDVQSPSKVLLNWLWGRSTPKVNDT